MSKGGSCKLHFSDFAPKVSFNPNKFNSLIVKIHIIIMVSKLKRTRKNIFIKVKLIKIFYKRIQNPLENIINIKQIKSYQASLGCEFGMRSKGDALKSSLNLP